MDVLMQAGTAVPVVVLAAAVLHAVWNALAHAMPNKLAGFTLINLAFVGVSVIWVCFTPLPDSAAWPFIAASAALQVAYQTLLLQAYRLGDFGQMYPVARGVAPMLVAVLSVSVLGQELSAPELTGILVISAGLVALALADGLPDRTQLPALMAALGTGVMIASYTIVDGTGVRRSDSVFGYIAWSFLLQGMLFCAGAFALGRRGLSSRLRGAPIRGLTGGMLSLTAYALVVWAQDHGDLASIAALRETSIVIAALLGTVFFRERLGSRRLAASATVVVGIAVLQLAHA
ncbi:membrane protein [Streptomyces brasiliensis]|uniref:Membrane protein n=2 Tax=Streptomyces brasiliensis TaxID=1954 RepID=A0A917L497_9ACTN|nr:membrane protein [Streptomyces brasiliensis]